MKNYIRFGLIAFAVLAVSATDVIAQDQNIQGLVSKLNRLERDIQTLNRQVYKGGTPPKSNTQAAPAKMPVGPAGSSAYIIRLEERLSQLEGELQNTTNLIEGINHNVDGMKGRLDKLVSDLDFRLSRLEGGAARPGSVPAGPPTVSSVPRAPGVQQIGPSTGGPVVSSGKPGTLGSISETELSAVQRDAKNVTPSPASAPVGSPSGAQQALLPKGSPTVQYRHAFSILRQTDYDKAELAFKEFIKNHPKDKLTPNARYWLGESFYVRANYRDAAEAFLRGYQQAPKGSKAPDTLLKLGMSLANLKKKQDACATFSKLAKDYPNASGNIKKHLKREVGRTGCK
jgi:tol-pal system protein YbgF